MAFKSELSAEKWLTMKTAAAGCFFDDHALLYGHVVDVKTDSRVEERKFWCAERKEKNLTRGQGRAKSAFESAFNFNFK